MAYSQVWTNDVPPGSEQANNIDQIFRDLRRDIEERMESTLVVDWRTDPVVAKPSVGGAVRALDYNVNGAVGAKVTSDVTAQCYVVKSINHPAAASCSISIAELGPTAAEIAADPTLVAMTAARIFAFSCVQRFDPDSVLTYQYLVGKMWLDTAAGTLNVTLHDWDDGSLYGVGDPTVKLLWTVWVLP